MPLENANERTTWLIELLALARPVQIADIGARLTAEDPVYKPLMDHDIAHLHGFEPEPEAFEALRAAAGKNVSLYQHAIGTPGPATFYAHTIGSLSSVYKLCASAAKYLGKQFWVRRPITEHQMTLVALDAVEGLPKLDVLKMDVQGAELGVLQGGRETLVDCLMIIPEVRFYRMYQDEPMWADVDTELRAQGFVLHKFTHNKSVLVPSSQWTKFRPEYASQLLDGDAIYIRNVENMDNLSIEQLKTMALLADVIAQSFDLCAACLDALRARDVLPKNATRQYVQRLPREVLAEPETTTEGVNS